MTLRLAFCSSLLLSSVAQAQYVPATHPFSGLSATASLSQLERDGPRFAGPRSDAMGIKAPSTTETIPLRLLKSPNDPSTRATSLIQRVKPAFRLSNTDIEIADVQDMIFFAETRIVRILLHL